MRQKRLNIGFIGDEDRGTMLRKFGSLGMTYFTSWGREDAESIVMFLMVMVENISDHAEGVGSIMIKVTPRGFEFDVQDGGTASHDFESLVGNSTKIGNGVNFGTGLRFLKEKAPLLRIDLEVDTTKGFHYSGIIPHI